jgi:hypothetical protein
MKLRLINRRLSVQLAFAVAVIGAYSLIASPAPASADAIACNIEEIAVWVGSRIHLKCNPGAANILFFAMSGSTFDASRVVSLAETATATRRRLTIFFDPHDLTGQAAIGCQNVDCRLIQAVFLPGQ